MKIYTITCHDVYNAGASLQAYALMTYLESLGHDVEIIDYKPDYLSGHYKFFSVANPKYNKNFILKFAYLTLKFPSRLKNYCGKRKRLFDSFKRDWLHCTPKRYISNDDLKQNLPVADIYIAGSDQIWNTAFPNGKDPAFYLDFAPAKSIKASYAASFATSDIPHDLKNKIKCFIERLDFVSVREKSAVKIVNDLGLENVFHVCDPVLLLSRNQWEDILKKSKFKKPKEKYILVYDFDDNSLVKTLAKAIANKNNLKIYSVFKCNYADKICYKQGPFEFLNYIRYAEFVISNSFHATVFSEIFAKDYYVVKRNEELNSRIYDFLSMIGANNRIIDSIESMEETKSNVEYKQCKYEISLIVKRSKEFINEVLLRGENLND